MVALCRSVVNAGVVSVSLGGGEPLEHPEWAEILADLAPLLPRTLTTHGLGLQRPGVFEALVAARPDKVHVSIHEPVREGEVSRVIAQVLSLESAGVPSGVNLVVRRSTLEACRRVVGQLAAVGVGLDRIVLLPLRGDSAADTPSPREIASVAGDPRFRSTSCLTHCHASPRFASIGWDKTVAWCSYTRDRRPLPELTASGLARALLDLPLTPCAVAARQDHLATSEVS